MPTQRINAKSILRHPYFDDLDKRSLPAPVVDDNQTNSLKDNKHDEFDLIFVVFLFIIIIIINSIGFLEQNKN